MKLQSIIAIVLLTFSTLLNGQVNYENSTRLNEGWEFYQNDLGSPWEAVRPGVPGSSEMVPIWTKVTLPHSFNAFDAVDPDVNYYQGPGWYRSNLDIKNPYKKGRTILHFEGSGQKTEVYVFTEKVGSHVGGYDEWSVDITHAVAKFHKSKDAERFKGKVPVLVRTDNSRDVEMIPSDLSDFNLYGGIYRYLNLVYTPATSFSFVHTDASVDENGKKGELKIKVGFLNKGNEKSGKVQLKIYSPENKLVAERSVDLSDFSEKELFSISINKPKLWSTDNPALYTSELTLITELGSVTNVDKFGFRHFEFVKNGPFKLNGKRLLLRGTHRHEDHAGVAVAMTEEMIVQELEMMKAMGINFIRLGHYQQSRIVLEQCDRLGLLVWEEIPWCRGGLGGEKYQAQAKRMLENMIVQHRNHPSVILWGMGNENDWPNDFPEFDKDKIRAFMKELHDLSHKIDDTRLTAIRRCDFCKDIIDVYSPSIWAGWYRGIFTDYKNVSYNEMQKVNHFLHVEWGGDSHARRHNENPYETIDKIDTSGKNADERAGDASLYGGTARVSRDGDWSESYICDLIDWHLKEQETMPWLTGTAYWPFKDFSTPVRPENPVPYMNQKGVVERDFTPKESYYVFQSYWTEKPMVHIYGHTWPTRWGGADELKMMKVYSNCTEAELFLNGQSLGTKKRNSQDFPASGLRWETKFKQGKNNVKVIGKKGKERVEDEITFDYETRQFGKPAKVVAKVIESTPEYAWIEAELQDEDGVVCLNSRDYFYFDSTGDGELVKNMGTSTASSKVQAYGGRARIKLLKNNGESVVSVKSDKLKTILLPIK